MVIIAYLSIYIIMDPNEYSAMKAALECQGKRVKWPEHARGVTNGKLRRKILKRVKDGRYTVKDGKIYYRINFRKIYSPNDAKGKFYIFFCGFNDLHQ